LLETLVDTASELVIAVHDRLDLLARMGSGIESHAWRG
jgi:hypothetical protein